MAKDRDYLGDMDASVRLIEDSSTLCRHLEFDSADFFHDLTHAVPLIILEGSEYKFLHKTIAEYFAAEYILNNKRREDIMRKIVMRESASRFFTVIKFLRDISSDLLEESVLTSQANKIAEREECSSFSERVIETLLWLYPIYCIVDLEPEDHDGGFFLEESLPAASDDQQDPNIAHSLQADGDISEIRIFEMDEVRFQFTLASADTNTLMLSDLLEKLMSDERIECTSDLFGPEGLFTFIPTAQTTRLTVDDARRLARYDIVVDSAILLLQSLQRERCNGTVKLLSKDKAVSFLNELSKRRSLEDELMNLL